MSSVLTVLYVRWLETSKQQYSSGSWLFESETHAGHLGCINIQGGHQHIDSWLLKDDTTQDEYAEETKI